SSRRRHTRFSRDWSSDVCSSDLQLAVLDCVGGIPHFEWSRELGEKSVHRAVDLAVKYGKLIDVHCDEIDDPTSRFVEPLNARVKIGRASCRERGEIWVVAGG